MKNSFVKAAVFAVLVCAIYIYIAEVITDISGGAKTAATAAGISPEVGEAIFWGKGKCHTCHSLGDQGSAIRAPNLGVFGERFTLPIGLRAAERAKEISAKSGEPMTAQDYFSQDHYDPGAYVVDGYKNEMPTVWKPPIALSVDDIASVELYLMAQGGEPDLQAVLNNRFYKKMKAEAAALSTDTTVEAFKPYLQGDPERGKAIFFNPDSKTPCGKCHTVGEQGGKVGPELTNVAGTRDIRFIIESVLDPSAVIAGGFEAVLIQTNDGELIAGVKRGEDDTSISIADNEGVVHAIPKTNIQRMKQQTKSIMPGNFRELLTMEEFHDLLAFLETLQ